MGLRTKNRSTLFEKNLNEFLPLSFRRGPWTIPSHEPIETLEDALTEVEPGFLEVCASQTGCAYLVAKWLVHHLVRSQERFCRVCELHCLEMF